MRTVLHSQINLGEQDISKIKLDPKSRDDIPYLLLGLQYIWCNPELKKSVFKIIQELIPFKVGNANKEKASADKGRPGMEQWTILVLGVLRLGLNADYDRIHELANQHRTIRQMLGHGFTDDEREYTLKNIKDNIHLFTPEILDRINQEVVRAGHKLLKKNDTDLFGRCDSFVVETNVHYPTDANLLYDAMRKTIEECAELCEQSGLSTWRQSEYNIRKLKKQLRKIQTAAHSTSKDEDKRKKVIVEANQVFIDQAESYLERARATRDLVSKALSTNLIVSFTVLDNYMEHAERQIDQIKRRVLLGEKIPHDEKVFSIFEPHTEWISKGKAGVPVELGVRVCVLEANTGFILHHRVMEKETDDKIAVPMVIETKHKFPNLKGCSFDKGFHSPQNQIDLKPELDKVVLPKKGRLSVADKEREYDPEFVGARQLHAAVESAINALEIHGLDMCPDHGIGGFKRYVALAVVARNIHRLGAVIRSIDAKKRGPYKKTQNHLKIAA
jgi:hypothetical protein